MKKCKTFTEDCYQHPKCLATLVDKYGDAHGYKRIGYKGNCCEYCVSLSIPRTCMIKKCGCHLPMGISNWINHGKQYQYFDYIDDKMLIEFRLESRNYPKFDKSMQINPLKQTVYKRLVKMKLKDMADKIEEIINKLNEK